MQHYLGYPRNGSHLNPINRGLDTENVVACVTRENGETEEGAELGDILLSGYGTKQNPEEAIRALSRAAAVGSAKAYMSLGKI